MAPIDRRAGVGGLSLIVHGVLTGIRVSEPGVGQPLPDYLPREGKCGRLILAEKKQVESSDP